MRDIYNLTHEKFSDYLFSIGEKRSKADMVFPAIYGKGVTDFSETGVKESLCKLLSKDYYFGEITCIDKKCSESADKYLFKLSDGSLAVRNLDTAEIVEQLLYVTRESGRKISGIAIMGIGEPLDNYDNVADFIDIAMYQKGFDIGLKHITLSTCGIVPKIKELSESRNPVNLAVSLHAPNDELRNRLMPINKKYPLSPLFEAIRHYSSSKNRRITLEYVMLKGVNDSKEHAKQLAELIGDSKCYVNIIRYNGSEGDSFECSDFETIMAFYDVLKKNKIGVTMRRELGASINGACGQLRADYLNK